MISFEANTGLSAGIHYKTSRPTSREEVIQLKPLARVVVIPGAVVAVFKEGARDTQHHVFTQRQEAFAV